MSIPPPPSGPPPLYFLPPAPPLTPQKAPGYVVRRSHIATVLAAGALLVIGITLGHHSKHAVPTPAGNAKTTVVVASHCDDSPLSCYDTGLAMGQGAMKKVLDESPDLTAQQVKDNSSVDTICASTINNSDLVGDDAAQATSGCIDGMNKALATAGAR